MFGVVLDVSMSPSAGPLVRGSRPDRGSHVVSHNFSVSSVATFFKGNHYYLIPAYDFHETSYASR